MKRYLHIIYILALLLVAGSASNVAWGKITYHILSLPFTTYQRDGENNIEGETVAVFKENIRVEAFRCYDDDQTVGLPDAYKSPLIANANYHYYAADKITKSASPENIYGYNNTTYYTYTINGTANNADNSSNYTAVGTELVGDVDIYVTYTYNPADPGVSTHIDLSITRDYTGDGLLSSGKEYNIHLKDRMLVLNQHRQNRPGAVLDGYYTNKILSSDYFSKIAAAGFNNTEGYRFFKFKFGGNDPYNITLYTAYDLPTTLRDKTTANDDVYANKNQNDYDKYIGTGKNVFKEYRGASFFAKMDNGLVSGNNMWLSSEADLQWTDLMSGANKRDNATIKVVPGYFKGPNDNKSTNWEMSPIFNSFAILNHPSGSGYVLVASKVNVGTNNWQPNSDNGQFQYLDYDGNGNNIKLAYSTAPKAAKVDVYEVREYVFRVKTPFGNNVDAICKSSDYYKDEAITTDMIPEALKRKFVNFTGSFKGDPGNDGTPEVSITSFADAQDSEKCGVDGSGRPIIYVEYEVSGAPFTAITVDNKTTGYTTATWYEMTDDKDSSGKKIKWDATNSVYKNDGGASEYVKESEFAFIGDPYELRIINRKLTAAASANHYVGSTERTENDNLDDNISDDGAGYKWEIPYDDVENKTFTLREFGSTNAYWHWNTTGSGNNIQYSTSESTRIKLMEIGKVNYTFKVVDLSGRVAIQATEELTPFTTLTGYANIPASIRSPFLADETVTFHISYVDGSGRSNLTDGNRITELPSDNSTPIYVKYTTGNLTSKNIKLQKSGAGQEFNVKLNGQYIYWNGSKVLSKSDATDSDLETDAFRWYLRGRDPYAMLIESKKATIDVFPSTIPKETITKYDTDGNGGSTTEEVDEGRYVSATITNDNDVTLTSMVVRSSATRFVAMMSNNLGVYEVLAATGGTTAGSELYYHIGRETEDNADVKIYNENSHGHGADELRFELFGSTEITYTLIDRAGTDLITVTSKNPRLALPSDYVSPLVPEYYYYKTKANAEYYRTNGSFGTEGDPITEISDDDGDNHVWVVYDEVKNVFGNTHPYLLKFLNGLSYKLEDGNDRLTTSEIKAMYPYFNGDGNLNIYGEPMKEEQMGGGSSTRPRWVWFFESEKNDPYHVKIYSRQTISFADVGRHGYLHTRAVHFNQDSIANDYHIVTGINFTVISGKTDTEYMILGVTGRYKLMTTDPVPVDLNGDGDTVDSGESAGTRQVVQSFEQYWKTYNMIKLHVLGIPASEDEFSKVSDTFVVPNTPIETTYDENSLYYKYNDTHDPDLNYRDFLDQEMGWHSYSDIANATRWNGYNDKTGSDGHTKKIVEKLEHWYQTFDMGNGEFDIESGDVPAVLVLLDRHGWEIMRKALPTGSDDPDRTTKLAALRAYDSPMVKEYQFWSSATKASGCHKYRKIEKAITQSASSSAAFTSTSLATLPPVTGKNAKDNMGNLQDHYVTYTVKEEYEKSYTYNYDDESASTASAFIILQNGQYAKDVSSTLTAQTAPSPLSSAIINESFEDASLWYAQPNLEIDEEMGITWATETGNTNEPYTKEETRKAYKDKTGFDPYNLQLKNVSSGKFFTIDMKQSILIGSGGSYIGDYTGGSLAVTLADKNTVPVESEAESYDHSHLKMTNQTFMAVQDAKGNMQLMPRFDHNTRINAFTTLADPVQHTRTATVDDPTVGANAMGAQTTFMVRPVVYDYFVIDNDGKKALHYKTGGEFYPSMPNHFKSPLAKNFKYYKTLEDSNSDGVFELGTLDDEITGSFATAGIMGNANIFIRYEYDEDYDKDNDNILQGRWMTMSLGKSGENLQWVYYNGTLNESGSGLFTNTKPATSPSDLLSIARQWHWKLLQSPSVSTSALYRAPDPYAVMMFNREANSKTNMGTPITVGTVDRFVLLNHSSGDGYALAKASDELTYSFLNGNGMTVHDDVTPKAASVAAEEGFSTQANTISDDALLMFDNDIEHVYTYKVITNGKLIAATQDQTDEKAQGNNFAPLLPEDIQSLLIDTDDYLYYETATIDDKGNALASDDEYTVVDATQIDKLYGLYDDVVYVRYPAFDRDKTPYLVPNERNNSSPVARGAGSNDVAIDLKGNLPYNIIWESDNMMRSSDGTNIIDGGDNDNSHALSATAADMWKFEGEDPYAIQIKRDGTTMYVDGSATLKSTAKNFMLLKKEGYDYGVFAETGNQNTMLTFSNPGTGYTLSTTTSSPTKFIPFALSVYHLIYHLVIAKSCPVHANPQSGEYVDIPYRKGNETTYQTSGEWETTDVKRIYGTTQRDLSTTYQLGETINGQDYSHDAGKVSLGDEMEVPDVFYRPNCNYVYYVEGIYEELECTTPNVALNNKYKGLEITKLMSDADLIGKTVRVNIAYGFAGDLETNAGDGFVTSVNQNLWYTFETKDGPFLAHYTNAWGLQCMEGRETRYTNDYLWTPLGDPYGFKMYNRYVKKNSSTTGDDDSRVMTTKSLGVDVNLKMLELVESNPGENQTVKGNEVYELLAEETTTPGYFLIHPVINNTSTKYYIKKDASDNFTKLDVRANATEWRFGLSPLLFQPYFDCVGCPGGLEQSVYNELKANAYEENDPKKGLFTAFTNGTATAAQLMTLQSIVFDTNNIVDFSTGYYRLHNQPGVSGISPVRYASGYLHDIEKTAGASSTAIPMHFYSKKGTSSVVFKELASGGTADRGYTKTAATRGDIPVLPTEYDPSTVFYINGSTATNNTISTATMSTQGLNVIGNKMTTGAGTTFTFMDIGGAVFLITDTLNPKTRNYLNFDQSYEESSVKMIYDLKFTHEVPTDDAKWCLEPANTQGLTVETHNGGEGYYYSTFCAPFDVALPDDADSKTYNAYVCTAWNTEAIHPVKVAASSPYAEGKFVPAATPVIIRTNDTSGKVKLSIPNAAPTTPALSCVFTGKYLEQELATEISSNDMVYTLGLPITGYGVTIDSGESNGEITNLVARDQSKTGVGFYRNATPNKELNESNGLWTPNNRYVLHNKIYYRADSRGASARQQTRSVDFVPVIFGNEEQDDDENGGAVADDICVYDLQGRMVATEQQVKEGTWRNQVPAGVYILRSARGTQGGRKVFKK